MKIYAPSSACFVPCEYCWVVKKNSPFFSSVECEQLLYMNTLFPAWEADVIMQDFRTLVVNKTFHGPLLTAIGRVEHQKDLVA